MEIFRKRDCTERTVFFYVKIRPDTNLKIIMSDQNDQNNYVGSLRHDDSKRHAAKSFDILAISLSVQLSSFAKFLDTLTKPFFLRFCQRRMRQEDQMNSTSRKKCYLY